LHEFDDIKERLRQAVDLVDLVGERVALKRAGRDLGGLCPFHQEKTPSFYVSPSKGIFKCFGCGAGGDIFTFVQLSEKVDFREAMRILADRAGIEMRTQRPAGSPAAISRSELARVNAWAADFYRRQYMDERKGAAARDYVAGRGISTEVAERFGLGLALGDGSPLMRAAKAAGIDARLLAAAGLTKEADGREPYDTFRNRLLFPIRDTMGRYVGFGGRALDDSPAKYLNTAQTALFDKGRCLFGLDLARPVIEASGRAVLVEGYFDCAAAHQAGVREAVATMGTAMTEQHADVLRRYCGRLVLVFDSDAAGVRAADRAVAVTVKYGLDVRIARVVAGKDPAEFLQTHSPEEFIGLLNSAEDALGFKWRQVLTHSGGGGNIRDRRSAVVEYVRFIAGHCRAGSIDLIQRGLIIGEVAKLLGLRPEEVQRQFDDIGVSAQPGQRTAAPTERITATATVILPASAEEAVIRTAIALLLSEPGLWPQLKSVFDVELIEDETLRGVAVRTIALAERVGEFALSELVADLENPNDAALATTLALSVEREGVDVAGTMAGVVSRLEEFALKRKARSAARHIAVSKQRASDPTEMLAAVQAAAEQSKFADLAGVSRAFGPVVETSRP
jgi:DNA primase